MTDDLRLRIARIREGHCKPGCSEGYCSWTECKRIPQRERDRYVATLEAEHDR